MKLSIQSEAAREAKAAEAFRLIQSGMTVPNACDQVGLTERQYYYWIARSSEAIEAIKGAIADQERRIVLEIATARNEALHKIAASIQETDNVARLMQIEAHLRNVQTSIEERHGISSMDRSAAEFLLTGPATSVQESRTTISVEPKDSGGVTVSISTPPEIIDMTAEDKDEE